nr:hypothetical protein [Tanacetum cinerariifolium]
MQPGNKESKATPALVLSDECLLLKDLSKSLFGRVKQFASLANIRKAVSNEGCADIKIQYMGELWVLLEFVSEDSMKLFQDNLSIGSWAFWIRAKEAPGWVPDFMEENDDEEQNDDGGFNVHESGSCGGDSDVEGVLETIFEESGQKENNLDEEHTDKQENHSGDPFSIYKLLKKKKDNVEKENNSEHSMKYPLGFTPKEGTDVVGHFKTSTVPRTGGSILSLVDELVKVISGGILCVWDPNSFRKSNATVSDYFIMIRGVWRQTGNDLLNIAVYAPHDLKDKQMMWDYLTYEIGKWKGEVGNRGFRFFHHWIEMEGFSKVVEDAWREGPSKYKDQLEALEAIIDKGDGNVEVVNKRMEVVNTLQKIDKICLSEMAQKAKVKWSIEEDENTSFFHGMLNKKWSLLNIRGIMVDEMWIESPNRVKGEFFHHFSSGFDKPDARRAHIEMRYPKTLTCDQQVELQSDVSNEEIKRAVWDSGIDKYHGPNGFTFGFYRRFWNLIENDVYDAVKPISLIGSLYKIVAKILANRLVGVLGDIVNEVQSAFIARRQILDGPFILNEALQWCKIKNKQSLIFKVDFEKAYDSVQWDFLDYILKKLDLVKNGVSGFKAALDL